MPTLQISIDDFKRHRDSGAYLVDKSRLIREVLDGSHALLLPRPRRFGKTMNLSMLRHFFELSDEETGYLFDDLAIAGDREAMAHQGQYPTVFLTLKDVQGADWETARAGIVQELSGLYRDFDYLADGLRPEERESYEAICHRKADAATLQRSLRDLVTYLYRHHDQPVVVLIDEYDSPVIEAYDGGYYEPMIDFMRAWLGGGLKHPQGQAVFRAVVTGVLRVARESIFSGLNNLKVHSLLSLGAFADKFGFTEAEVERVMSDFGLSNRMEEVRDWYNGYVFGDTVMYNPWSVLNYIDDQPESARPKWLNTSANTLVHQELKTGGLELKRDLENLLAGQDLRYPISENILFTEISGNRQNVWSFLTFSGYLRAEDPKRDPITDSLTYRLSIPNREVREVYKSFVRNWHEELQFRETDELLRALVGEDYEEFERLLGQLVRGIFSCHDVDRFPEAAYHAFVLGLLANLRAIYEVRSNAESGYGRADIILCPRTEQYPVGYVIEFKSITADEEVEPQLEAAFEQIGRREYITQLQEAGVAQSDIRRVAVVVAGKRVAVRCRQGIGTSHSGR